MLSNKGFTLIEVLVASIILFFSILIVNSAYKQYISYKIKQEKYENIYITGLSLMNEIDAKGVKYFINNPHGRLNGIRYTIKVEKIISKRNYAYYFDPSKNGNSGYFLVTLYKLTMQIANKVFILYKTEYQKA